MHRQAIADDADHLDGVAAVVVSIATFSAVDWSVGTVVQTHAVVNLSIAGALAAWIVVATRSISACGPRDRHGPHSIRQSRR